jgi:hypothetical protein
MEKNNFKKQSAIERANGDKEWFYNGKQFYPESLEGFSRIINIIHLYPVEH